MNQKEILLVEDNPDDAEFALKAFTKARIENKIVWLKDGTEALDYLMARGEYSGRDVRIQPGLILLDLKLLRTDGLDVLKQVRSNPLTSSLPVVILSTSRHPLDLRAAYKQGANSFVCKPLDPGEFAAAITGIADYWIKLNEQAPL